jgi:hypothetical protein
MVAFSILSGLSALPLLLSFVQHAHGVSLEVSTEGGNSSSPILYGFMFEVCGLDKRPTWTPMAKREPRILTIPVMVASMDKRCATMAFREAILI